MTLKCLRFVINTYLKDPYNSIKFTSLWYMYDHKSKASSYFILRYRICSVLLFVDLGRQGFGCCCSLYTYICGPVHIWCCQWLMFYWRKVRNFRIKRNCQRIKTLYSLQNKMNFKAFIREYFKPTWSYVKSSGLKTRTIFYELHIWNSLIKLEAWCSTFTWYVNWFSMH